MSDPKGEHSTVPQSAAKRARADVRAFQFTKNPMFLWRAFATCHEPNGSPIALPPMVRNYFVWCRWNLDEMGNEGRAPMGSGRPRKPSGDEVRRALGLACKGRNYLQLFARSDAAPSPPAGRPAVAQTPAEWPHRRKLAAGWVADRVRQYHQTGNAMFLWMAFAACYLRGFPEIPLPPEVVQYLLRCWRNLRDLPGKDKAAPSGDDVRRAIGFARKGRNELQMFWQQGRAMSLAQRLEMPSRRAFEAKNPDKKLGPGSHKIPLSLLKQWHAAEFNALATQIAPASSVDDAKRKLQAVLAEGRRLNGKTKKVVAKSNAAGNQN